MKPPSSSLPDITPTPLPRDARSILLVGGSFDPPHRWHTAIAAAARDKLFADIGWILFVPAAKSPLKGRAPLASNKDRIAMLRLAIADMERAAVWTDEVDRARKGRPSYTIDTVWRLLENVSDFAEVRLLIGADQAVSFHQWLRHDKLMSLAEPVVALRKPYDTAAALRRGLLETGAWSKDEVKEWIGRIVPCEVSPISSTAIREAISAGREQQSREVVAPVMKYIQSRGLYRAKDE